MGRSISSLSAVISAVEPVINIPDYPDLEEILAERVSSAVPGLERHLQTLAVLGAVAPLLGLLGTVSGMIKVFEVITVFGTGNTRGRASGISEALVTTMAGLFTALSGLYFVSDLESRAEETARRFEAELVEEN